MKKVTVKLKSVSPMAQGRYHGTEKLEKESPENYEKRTWRNKAHTDEDGNIFIPPLAFKNCLSESALYLSIQIKGKGKSTYTKHFEAGISVMDPIELGVNVKDLKEYWMFVPSDGRRGGKKRVNRCFPVVPKWEGTATVYIFDETITEDIFKYHLDQSGKFIGIGSFRPRNNGYFGRFEVVSVKWEDA